VALSESARTKGLARSQELLGPGVHAQHYGIGLTGPDPRRTRIWIVIVFAVMAFVTLVLVRIGIVPGALLVMIVYWSIDKPTAVVTSGQVAHVLERSFWNGRPSRVLVTLPTTELVAPHATVEGSFVHVPGLRLWLKRGEYEALGLRDGAREPSESPLSPMVPSAPVEGRFCSTCGARIADGAAFCARCGTAVRGPAPPP